MYEPLDDLDLISQAITNIGEKFGGNSKVLLSSLAKEIRRLKKWREDEAAKDRKRIYEQHRLYEKKMGQKHPDDDIPF